LCTRQMQDSDAVDGLRSDQNNPHSPFPDPAGQRNSCPLCSEFTWTPSRENTWGAHRLKKSMKAGLLSTYDPEEPSFPDHPYFRASRRSKRRGRAADRSKRFRIFHRKYGRRSEMTYMKLAGL